MLNKSEISYIEEIISESVTGISSGHGGSINQAFLVKTNTKKFFLKRNDREKYPHMFQLEEKGLHLLRNNSNLVIPQVISVFDVADDSYLLLEWVDKGSSNKRSFFDFGRRVALLHNQSSEKFGLEYDNYIGSLKQINSFRNNWNDFFIENRINVLAQMAFDNEQIDKKSINNLEKIYLKLNDFFPPEKPSLLHGDLWKGNFMFNQNGYAVIYDPAVYYGHRLMDLGMSNLFGGLPNDFYEGYQSVYKLENNWQDAIQIANLYPLLVHVNLFGLSYLSEVKHILKKYV